MSKRPMTPDPVSPADLSTPALLLDADRLDRNIARLRAQAARLGIGLRPHLKTLKSVDAAQRILDGGTGPATVSTLAEAQAFFQAGVWDILYAVGIAPAKLDRVARLRAQGCDLTVLLDAVPQAKAVAEASRLATAPIPALIEIDSDGHRGGLSPDDPQLITVAQTLDRAGALKGVLTHAGGSYGLVGVAAHTRHAELERAACVKAAERLRAAGLPCPVVSIGSTPTALAAEHLEGVTELRAGVCAVFDLVMAGIGVCGLQDIALSVLTTVIGHRRDKGWILIDAGWMALSRDRGTAAQSVDQGFGLVCDLSGRPIEDLIVTATSQEHGTVTRRSGNHAPPPDLPIGTRLRILPNHACATAAQHAGYHVLDSGGRVTAHWPRLSGW